MTPSAARRKAKGSREPVGSSPIGKKRDQRIDLVGKRDGDRFRTRSGSVSLGPSGL